MRSISHQRDGARYVGFQNVSVCDAPGAHICVLRHEIEYLLRFIA